MPNQLPLLWTDVPLHNEALTILKGHVWLSGPGVPVANAENPPFEFETADAAIVGTRVLYDATAFAKAARLKIIARTGIGYDNIDVSAASAAGVCTINTPEAPTESTAEFAIALMFAVTRHIPAADHNSKDGLWKRDSSIMGSDLADKTLGLVGFGRIGRRVAEMARAIHMRICAFDPLITPSLIIETGAVACDTLPELLVRAQVLSLHVPFTPATYRLISAEQLALLPRGAVLINTARGQLIDEAATLAALESGQLNGAGFDVWEKEPADLDNLLFRHPKVVATPHMAAYTDEGQRRSHVAAAKHVLDTLRGVPPTTLIDPSMWPLRRM